MGPAGTFTGTFNGPMTFTGDASFNGTIAINGNDLFNAVFQGTYPAVVSSRYSCGAFSTTDVAPAPAGAATFGRLVFTTEGSINFDYSIPWSVCSNICGGPTTFFLISPTAQTIAINAYVDNGPSKVYLDGTDVGTYSNTANITVNVPQGPFALSFVPCSFDGGTIGFWINNKFITEHNLKIDYNRTFHRNGL